MASPEILLNIGMRPMVSAREKWLLKTCEGFRHSDQHADTDSNELMRMG
jgi:hypothetical protein